MPNELQTQLTAAVKSAETIMANANGTGQPWTPEAVDAYSKAVASARAIKTRLEEAQQLEAIKKWAAEPDGQSAVANGFVQTEGITDGSALPGWTGETVYANDGNMPGIGMGSLVDATEEPTGKKSFKAGELYAMDRQGEAKLKALKSGQYKDSFAHYIKMAALHGPEWRFHMKSGAMKVLQEGLDTSGGFWVPPDIRSELVKKMATIVGIRQNAFAFTTGSNLVQFPKVNYTTDDNYTAGTVPSWTAEAPSSDVSEATNPIAGRVNIPIHTATVAVILTRAMIEDNLFDILGYISALLGESYGLFEDSAFVTGTGAGQPQGLTIHADAATAASSGGMYVPSGTSAAFTWEASSDPTKGILGIEAALPPQYDAAAKWYATKKGYSYIRGLLDGSLRPLWLATEAYPNFNNGYGATLLGAPIVKDQFFPAIAANSLSLAYGDMSGYYIADRVGLSVQVLNEVRALKDEVVIYARKRVGGQLVHPWKLKLQKLSAS